MVKYAKTKESFEKEVALENFQLAYNKYTELENLIEDNRRGLSNARYKAIGHHSLRVLETVLAAAIGAGIHFLAVSAA